MGLRSFEFDDCGGVAAEQADDPGDREDEAVPDALKEAGRGGIDRGRRLLRTGAKRKRCA
jgi:hypothetical protein